MWSNPFAFSRPGLGAAVPPRGPSSHLLCAYGGCLAPAPPRSGGPERRRGGAPYAAPCPGGRTPGWTRGGKTTGWLTVFDVIGLGRSSVGLAVKCFTVIELGCIVYTSRVRVLPAANTLA